MVDIGHAAQHEASAVCTASDMRLLTCTAMGSQIYTRGGGAVTSGLPAGTWLLLLLLRPGMMR